METVISESLERMFGDVGLTLDGIGRMRFRLGHGLRRSDHYVLNVCHCVDESLD